MANQLLANPKTIRSSFKINVTLASDGRVCLLVDFGDKEMNLPLTPDEADQLSGLLCQGALVSKGRVVSNSLGAKN